MNNSKNRIQQWIRNDILSLSAYHVQASTGLTKLDAMENPYTWSDELKSAWLESIKDIEINRYPDPVAQEVVLLLRQTMNIPTDAAVMLGNGSDELIQIMALALSGENRTILAPEPGFVMYKMIAMNSAMKYYAVQLKNDFTLDLPAMLHAIEQTNPALIFLAYPNNPTGNLFAKQDIQQIIQATSGLVIIDEAYHAFTDQSFMSEIMAYDNVLIMRTVSKMGLAGLRLGLLVGAADWILQFDKVRLPYNINVLTQASLKFALQHQHVLDAQTQQICTDRKTMFDALHSFKSLTVYPSATNFLLFRTASGQANRIFNALIQQKILIKNLNGSADALQDCLRVTIGTAEQNRSFIKAISAIL